MGLRRHAFIVGVVVTALGILVYCYQWSNLQFHTPWQPPKDADKGLCDTCDGTDRPFAKESSRGERLTASAGLVPRTVNGTPRKISSGKFESYTPPPVPCLDPKFVSKPQTDTLSHGHLITESKNPCWWNSTDRAASSTRLHCLPYFFLAGVSKCGSTDIFSRLSGHPQVVPPGMKEPRWFDWRRFVSEEYSFPRYVSNFMQASWQISRDLTQRGASDKVVGDGSPTYFWRNFHWEEYPGNEGCQEPRFVVADTIHRLLPDAKIIFSFRNPVTSLYSKYLSRADKGAHCSPDHFHQVVEEEIGRYRRCFARSSVRSCAYNISMSRQARVRLEKGLYAVFLSDWLRVFPRKQLHVIRFEDYIQDIAGHLQGIFRFLELKPMPDNDAQQLAALPAFHQGHHYKVVGQMLPATRRLLQQFYAPFNAQLAELMNDTKYLWATE